MAAAPAFTYRSTAEEVTAGIDLSGKVIVVTGANSGIGEETVRVLALRGASVVLACRNVESAEKSKSKIVEALANADGPSSEDLSKRLIVMALDLSSLASVRQFAEAFLARGLPLHILINNAGIMMCPFKLNDAGHESQFATNHLGHFLLTNLLLPKLIETAKSCGQESRIVILSSSLHAKPYPKEGIRFEALDSPKGYTPEKSYGQSKLANLLHARELAKRLKADGAPVTVNALHPGVILTGLMRHALPPGTIQRFVFNGLYAVVFRWFWKTIPEGASTQCYVAVHPAVAGVSGHFFMDNREAEDAASAFSKDEAMAKRLWEISVRLTAS